VTLAPVPPGPAVLDKGKLHRGIQIAQLRPALIRVRTYSDAFTKRESASEEMYIKQEEKARYATKTDQRDEFA
jgi:hypothetical protein